MDAEDKRVSSVANRNECSSGSVLSKPIMGHLISLVNNRAIWKLLIVSALGGDYWKSGPSGDRHSGYLINVMD